MQQNRLILFKRNLYLTLIPLTLIAGIIPTTAFAQGVCLETSRSLLAVGRKSDVNMKAALYDGTSGGFLEVWSTGHTWGDDNYTSTMAFGDVDGDGIQELLLGRKSDTNMRWTVYDDGSAGFVTLVTGGEGWGDDHYTTAMAAGDIDGDGIDEIAIARKSSVNMRWAIYDDALAGFGLLQEGGSGWGDDHYATSVAFGDIDGDGIDEFAVGRKSNTNMRWAIYDDALAGFGLLQEGGSGWGDDHYTTSVAFGDIDGDGIDEFALGRKSNTNMRWVVYDDALNGFAELQSGGDGWGDDHYTTSVAFGDIDGDGIDEFALGRKSNTNMRWAVYDDALNGFTELQSGGDSWGDDHYTKSVSMGDIDGDGIDELAIARYTTINWRWAVYDDALAGFTALKTGGEGWGSSHYATTIAIPGAREVNGADSDGDGLLDVWETNGLDTNCDGITDVPLNLMGADPLHKDIYIELDWISGRVPPSQAGILAIKAAFNAAPANAGGVVNPDGMPGIHFHVDTGAYVDPNGIEPGPTAGACDDNVDNDGDGLIDELDPDCINNFGIEGIGLCTDGIDNDNDGLGDAADPDCMGIPFNTTPPPVEGGGRCNDGVDNNANGLTDAADPFCFAGDNYAAFEGVAGRCNDGIDNDGNGVADGADPQCRRGGALLTDGGLTLGSTVPIPATSIRWLDGDYFAAKAVAFDQNRRFVFRYSILGPRAGDGAREAVGAAGTCFDGIDDDADGFVDCDDVDCNCVTIGGQAEIGGNDFIAFNDFDPGSYMHEFGHTLNLGHGGNDGVDPDHHNCKPNHVSIMNYDHQSGILQTNVSTNRQTVGGQHRLGVPVGAIIDFAPPRYSTGRNPNAYPSLNEGYLNEAVPVDVSALDTSNQTLFVDGAGVLQRVSVLGLDYNGDTFVDGIDWNGDSIVDTVLHSVDIDIQGATSRSSACAANSGIDVLQGRDEWTNIALPFRQWGDSISGPINPAPEPDPTLEELQDLYDEVHTADLNISLSGPEYVHDGDVYSLEVSLENLGPYNADAVAVFLSIPADTAVESTPSFCYLQPSGVELFCQIGGLSPDELRTFVVVYRVNTNTSGSARSFTATTSHAGPDPDALNNWASITLATIPAWMSFEDSEHPWVSPEFTLTQSGDVTDGEWALGVNGCKWGTVNSPEFSTADLEVLGTSLLVDVKIPSQQQNEWWHGDLQAFVNVTSAGVNNQYLIKWIGFTDLPKDEWVTLELPVSEEILSALSGDFPRAMISFAINHGSCTQPLLLDNVRFGGTLTPRHTFHSPLPDPVRTNDFLSFEIFGDWHSTAPIASESGTVLDGASALRISASGYSTIDSRPFDVSELSTVGHTIGLNIQVPNPQPNPYWTGDVQLFVTCQNTLFQNHYIGRVDLTHLFFNEYQLLKFPLSSEVGAVLGSSGNICEWRIALNVADGAGDFLFDAMGFLN